LILRKMGLTRCSLSKWHRGVTIFKAPGVSPYNAPRARQKMFFTHIFVAVVVTCRS
jgi:hypothetical protein